jgi:hypothetical protein
MDTLITGLKTGVRKKYLRPVVLAVTGKPTANHTNLPPVYLTISRQAL